MTRKKQQVEPQEGGNGWEREPRGGRTDHPRERQGGERFNMKMHFLSTGTEELLDLARISSNNRINYKSS